MKQNFGQFYKAVIILFTAFCLPFFTYGQAQFELSWQAGTLVLTSGDTIRGPLTLTLPNDIVRVQLADGSISTFTAVNVKNFLVQQEVENNRFFRRRKTSPLDFKRQYRSLMWNHDKDYSSFKSPAFFVVLQEGKQTLLMRENLERRTDSYSPYASYPGSRQIIETRVEKFYLLTDNDQIRPIRNPKKDLPAAFPKKEKEITSFAKTNKLDFNDPVELSRIVAYANSL